MNFGIIIQARLGSTRLPGKILKDFYGGKTLLETVIENLKKTGAKIIVATSVNPNNDKLETFLKERNITVFRGSEDDVLSRFIEAAEANGVDGIVRICSDNPFWIGTEWQTLLKRPRIVMRTILDTALTIHLPLKPILDFGESM